MEYALDGIDVWVQEARVMDKEKYLRLIRKREDQLLQAIERLAVTESKQRLGAYHRVRIPDCVVLTPYIKVSLPQEGSLHCHRSEPDSWNVDSPLNQHYSSREQGGILIQSHVATSQKDPFAVNVTMNAQELQGRTPEDLKRLSDETLQKVASQLQIVTSQMPLVQSFLDRINAAHNAICVEDIEFRERLRRAS